MKYLALISLCFFVACSSSEKASPVKLEKVTNDSFRKAKPLAAKDLPDYYPLNIKSEKPALQDETIERYSENELSEISPGGDPLLDLSIKCSKRDFKDAFLIAARIFNEYQKIPGYWNLVGNCHLNQGSHRKALLFYNKALEMVPSYVPALNNIGVMYSRLGQDQKALIAFERANKLARFSKTPRYNLAKLYLTYGLAESALPLFQGLLSTSEKDVDLLNAVGSCYFLMSDYQKAWSYYQRIPKDLWDQAEYGLNIAVTLKKISQHEEALSVFGKIDNPRTQALKNYHAAVEKQLGAL